MTKKETIKEIWIDQIKTAISMANEAIENCEDNGTCNFDSCLVEKESIFTWQETIDIFQSCGLNASKYNKKYISIDVLKGQAEKNTKWHKTLKTWLEEQGFKCSMHYQMD